MQGDDLVADDVVTCLKVLGDRDCGGEVALDQVVGDPGVCAGVDEAGLRDLAPAEGAGGQCCAVTVAGRDVVYDGPLVAVGPGVPVEGQRGASSSGSVEASGCCALVAVYVNSADGGGLDESEVLVQRVPAGCLRATVCW